MDITESPWTVSVKLGLIARNKSDAELAKEASRLLRIWSDLDGFCVHMGAERGKKREVDRGSSLQLESLLKERYADRTGCGLAQISPGKWLLHV